MDWLSEQRLIGRRWEAAEINSWRQATPDIPLFLPPCGTSQVAQASPFVLPKKTLHAVGKMTAAPRGYLLYLALQINYTLDGMYCVGCPKYAARSNRYSITLLLLWLVRSRKHSKGMDAWSVSII